MVVRTTWWWITLVVSNYYKSWRGGNVEGPTCIYQATSKMLPTALPAAPAVYISDFHQCFYCACTFPSSGGWRRKTLPPMAIMSRGDSGCCSGKLILVRRTNKIRFRASPYILLSNTPYIKKVSIFSINLIQSGLAY